MGECVVRAGTDGATPLLPQLADMRDAARKIALAVAKAAVEDGVAPEATEAELRDAIWATQWTPRYASCQRRPGRRARAGVLMGRPSPSWMTYQLIYTRLYG
ncbi:hypothetical protein [Streptomyces sp. V4I2]|uniref:hypothetical protein n=1 Tax=Streptomyces sp. V4I2 TaxID=3042280 RepID=UPI00278A609D|nr:hypothetical protein [Streptomyces sp. V4I2]MDQ1042489.1 hypothetical protein [Streptomyces sp. V4I2]